MVFVPGYMGKKKPSLRDIGAILEISIGTVLKALKSTKYKIKPKQTAFTEDNHDTGKEYTVGIEGNNCRLRHRIRRAFCWKVFDMAFFYINYGFV
jgi:hypothetical protein